MAVSGHYQKTVEKIKNIQKLDVHPGISFFELEPLTDSLKEKAKNELRETPEIVNEALAEIRKLIQDEADLIVPDDDFFLTKFLRPCKWYAKSAFSLMKRHFSYIKNHPRFCDNLVPKNEYSIFTTRILTPLPFYSKDGCGILLLKVNQNWNPKEVSVDAIFRGVVLLSSMFITRPANQVNGVRSIIDLDGLSLSQILYFKPSHAVGIVEWFQSAFPGRLKSVDIINHPYIFNMVFAIIKPFLDKKLMNRVILHGYDKEALKLCYDTESLPKEYGGESDYPLTESFGDSLYNYLCNFNEEFEELSHYGYSKLS